MENSKKWWQSKTVIFNVVAGIVGIATSMQGQNLPPEAEKIFAMVVMVGNVVLRFFTTQPVTK